VYSKRSDPDALQTPDMRTIDSQLLESLAAARLCGRTGASYLAVRLPAGMLAGQYLPVIISQTFGAAALNVTASRDNQRWSATCFCLSGYPAHCTVASCYCALLCLQQQGALNSALGNLFKADTWRSRSLQSRASRAWSDL
jgi:hypothetical protein